MTSHFEHTDVTSLEFDEMYVMELAQSMLYEFQTIFKTPMDPEFWVGLIKEEALEAKEAEVILRAIQNTKSDLRDEEEFEKAQENFLKELCDCLYVTAGLINASGDQFRFGQFDAEISKAIHPWAILMDEVVYSDLNLYTEAEMKEALRRVHISNMSKRTSDGTVIRNGEGKVLKGPNYRPPILNDIVNGFWSFTNKVV